MKIRIGYTFYTDGDYTLRDPEKFGCTGIDVEIEDDYYNFVGMIDFEDNSITTCKMNAKQFLEQLLCDGIHILHTHYWLMKDFYDIIESLLDFIDNNNSGISYKELSGNYDGTMIGVEFI